MVCWPGRILCTHIMAYAHARAAPFYLLLPAMPWALWKLPHFMLSWMGFPGFHTLFWQDNFQTNMRHGRIKKPCGGCTYESILEFSLRSVSLRLPQSPFPEVWSRAAVALSLSLLVRAGIFSYSRAERPRPRPSRSLTHLSQTGKLKKNLGPGSSKMFPS